MEYIAAVQPQYSRMLKEHVKKKLLRMGGQEQVTKEEQSQVKNFVLLPIQSLKWTVLVPK